MGKGRNEGEGGGLSAASALQYELVLRGLDGFLQGRPATDESVAARIDGLRRREVAHSSAAAIVSALARRSRQ